MIRSAAFINPVDRSDAEFRVRPFLQLGLGVALGAIGPRRPALPIAQYEPTGDLKAAVEIDRGDEAFDHVGAHVHHPLAGQFLHVGAGADIKMKIEFVGDRSTGFGADQLVQTNRELAFPRRAEGAEQKLGDAEPENPVAEEFQPFVIAALLGAGAGMA